MTTCLVSPAEGTSYRLAALDKKRLPGIKCANEDGYRSGASPFYTNSTHLPVDYTDDLFEALALQDELQTKYTGGTVLHVFVGEMVEDPDIVKELIRRIVSNFRLPYFTLTPTFSVCPSDGYLKGEKPVCPRCGCNLACPYCHNPELARGFGPGIGGLDDAAVARFLESRRGLLDGVVLCGGEPTVQPGVRALCRSIKSMGYAVKLDTNGGLPGVLAGLIEEESIDYIAMDVKTDPDLYSTHLGTETGGRAVAESIPLVMDSGVEYEFRTTCARPIVNTDVIESIAGRVSGADLYVLQRLRKDRSLDPAFFDPEDRCFDESLLLELKKTAEPLVKRCVIR